ncbi:hypothetical protein BDN71DRAFT_1508973 [Pleurotus eryngii]|uniref:Uncharacterized protein n=1 Tax=Pleurotus eryngii TaxID=5323 RepID=A0A9P6D6H2_PLEER|nr:hypothetical protein BDN71DRAFT_1508973 [Pleurotus eryngii]
MPIPAPIFPLLLQRQYKRLQKHFKTLYADIGDEEKDDEDDDEEAAGAAKGEVASAGDGSDGDNEGNDTIMDVDVNITPRKPASKHEASQSPLTDKHTSKAQCHTVSHSSAASSAASLPVPSHSPSLSNNLQELRGVSQTTDGFANGNAFSTAANMADFVPVDGPLCDYGLLPTLVPILKILARKFPTVTESAISLFDVNGKWKVAGPFAIVLEYDMDEKKKRKQEAGIEVVESDGESEDEEDSESEEECEGEESDEEED